MRLDLAQVTAAYGDAVALRDVSLIVPDGEVVALLGPNGAGKSTLLSVVSGLIQPTSGAVALDRVDATAWPVDARVRSGLCHITEGRAVFPGLTVRENLRMFHPHRDGGAFIDRAISAFPRLGERINQLAGTMSGGEQQMLAVSRAYVEGARLVLLDEISFGLAPIIADEILASLTHLASTGVSVLVVEQYVAKALAIASTAYILSSGRVVFAGEAAEVADADVFEHYMTGAR